MHFLLLLILLLALLLPAPSLYACQTVPDPNAFLLEATSDVQVLPNGLLMVSYADPATGRITHVTLHRILATLSDSVEDLFTEGAVPVTLYTSERTDGGLVYAVYTHPLYFGADPSEDGFPTRLWEDAQEDGLNGNEIFLTRSSSPDIELDVE